MSEDIIDRLNMLSNAMEKGLTINPDQDAELIRNAADEIDRLRHPERDAKAKDMASRINPHVRVIEALEEIVAEYRQAYNDADLARIHFSSCGRGECNVRGSINILEIQKQAAFSRIRELMEANP